MHSHHRPATAPGGPRSRSVFLLLLLSVAQLMVILDISAVNVALPDLAKDLSISGEDISWTITSYSLLFGSLLLLGGRAADLLGRRRVFLAGLGVFTASSLVTALAGDASMLSPRGEAKGSAPHSFRRPRCRSSRPHSREASAPRPSECGVPSAGPAPPSGCCWAVH